MRRATSHQTEIQGASVDFASACAALGVQLSEAQTTALLKFLDLLLRWNAVYNLTSVRDPVRMLTLHLLDCLAVVRPLRYFLGDTVGSRLVDVGSGGGLPGVVLAVTEPEMEVCCVDAVGKKAAFVRQVAAELSLPNLSSRQCRVEKLDGMTFNVVASRAFASLPDFVDATKRLLLPGGAWMAMKGKVPTSEIDALPGDIETFHVEQLTVPGLNAERCVVWMRPTR